MQPHHEMVNTLHHELTVDDCCSSTLHISGPLRPNQSGHHLHQHQYLQFQQHPQQKQRQIEPCHQYEQANYQLCQHTHQFQASQQEQQGGYLPASSGQHHYYEGLPHYLGVPNCLQLQGESTARVSFWKTFNSVLSDAKGKNQQLQEKERCWDSENNYGELETVCILARNTLETTHTGSDSAHAAENLHAEVNGGLLPVSVCHHPNVSATATTFREEASMRRARKRTRKMKKVEEEMDLMTAFFTKLVKRVINQQEVLQNRLLEVIERMDKSRTEREEAWRRQESEIYDREAIAREHEGDLAARRHSSIVSFMEKITGQSFNQESTNYSALKLI